MTHYTEAAKKKQLKKHVKVQTYNCKVSTVVGSRMKRYLLVETRAGCDPDDSVRERSGAGGLSGCCGSSHRGQQNTILSPWWLRSTLGVFQQSH